MINKFYSNVSRLPVLIALVHMFCIVAIMVIHYSVNNSSSSNTTLLFLITNTVYVSSFTSALMLFFGPYYFLEYRDDGIAEKAFVALALLTSIAYFVMQ